MEEYQHQMKLKTRAWIVLKPKAIANETKFIGMPLFEDKSKLIFFPEHGLF